MKAVLGIIGVIIVILLFGTLLSGINSAKTDERTDSFTVVTGGGITTGDVVLVTPLYTPSLLDVVSITSDLGTDVPLQTVYTALTRTLTVGGLTASQTRTLSVTYQYDALSGDSASAGTFLGFLPLLIIIAVVVIVVALMIAAFKNR